MNLKSKICFIQRVSITTTIFWIIFGGSYIIEIFEFILCSEKFNYVRLYIFHHLVTFNVMYFTWMLNLHRAGTIVMFLNSIVQNLLLKSYQIFKILKLKKFTFWSFWIYFVIKIFCLFIFCKMSYIFIFDNSIFTHVPLCPSFYLINAFVVLLVILFTYSTIAAYRQLPSWLHQLSK